jgi:hypothetical protein
MRPQSLLYLLNLSTIVSIIAGGCILKGKLEDFHLIGSTLFVGVWGTNNFGSKSKTTKDKT